MSTIPTIGFNVEKLQYKRCEMTAWDVGGQERLRRLWRHYYTGTDALIFVVDSADRERLSDAAEELTSVLSDPGMSDCKSVLVYANKQDLISAKDADEISELLNLSQYGDRAVQIQNCSAKLPADENGLQEGMEWMVEKMSEAGGGGGGGGDNTK